MSQFDFSSAKSELHFSFEQDSGNNTEGESFPYRLKEYEQWLITHDKPWDSKWHKRPKHPTNWNDEDANLLSFEEAYSRFESTEQTGLAFRFSDNDPFVGFDLDDVMVNGNFTDEALSIVRRLNSYTEVSSSGTGLHIIAEGERLDDRMHRNDLTEAGHLEVYDKNRYFVLTEDVYEDFTSIEKRLRIVQEVQNDYLPKQQEDTLTGQQMSMDEQGFGTGELDTPPEKVYRTIKAYVKSERHTIDQGVLQLWEGSNAGWRSASEADMAFVKQLYYWCKGDQCLIDDCFRASGRMRSKWDEVHRSDGTTYGKMTIRKVCQTNSSIFKGRYVK